MKNPKKARLSQASAAHRALMWPVLCNAKHTSTSQRLFHAFRGFPPNQFPVSIHFHLMLIFLFSAQLASCRHSQYCSTHEGYCHSMSIYAIPKRIIMDLICLNAGRTRRGGSVATEVWEEKNSEGLLCCLLPSGKISQSCASSITCSAPRAGQAPCRPSLSNIRS